MQHGLVFISEPVAWVTFFQLAVQVTDVAGRGLFADQEETVNLREEGVGEATQWDPTDEKIVF